jgi:hypothetical protein
MAGIYANVMQKDPFLCPREWRLRPVLDFKPGVSDDRVIDLCNQDGVVSPPHYGREKVANLVFVSYRLKVGRVDLRVQSLHLRSRTSVSKSASTAFLVVTVMHPTSRFLEGVTCRFCGPEERPTHGKRLRQGLAYYRLSLNRGAVRLLLVKVGEQSYRLETSGRLLCGYEKLNVCFDCGYGFIILIFCRSGGA